MSSVGEWALNQQNLITFVLVDATNTEVAGLGGTYTLSISKAGGAFVASGGTKAEISNGWYSYLSTIGEADTPGPISIRVIGAGTVQQNLEYVVARRNVNAVEWAYVVTDSVSTLPVAGLDVWISTDLAGTNVIWSGVTDAFGAARNADGDQPWLDPGAYFFWVQGPGVSSDDFPDEEVVS